MRTITYRALVALVLSAPAYAFMLPDPVASPSRAETIVDATIISVNPQTWMPADRQKNGPPGAQAGEPQTCGVIYTARVKEVFKGSSDSRITFAAPAERLAVGTHAIFFLARGAGFTDGGDVIYEKSVEESECDQHLPELKGDLYSIMWFASDEWVELHALPAPPELHPKMMLENGALVEVPTSKQIIEQNISTIQGKAVVQWDELRAWIRAKVSQKAW